MFMNKSIRQQNMFFIKMGHSRPLFVYFQPFQTNITILQQIYVKKCPSSIWCRDSNSQPLEHKSSPITARPGLSPKQQNMFLVNAIT